MSNILLRLASVAFGVLLLGAALPALAVNCSDPPYNGVIDGDFVPAPSQIQIDTNCTIRNFPASNPLGTNFSFMTQPGQTDERWLITFDNVFHTGQMACNSVAGHAIWFVNGSSSAIQEGCQNLLIPVEKIDKRNPAGPATATVGVPFTYTLTMPVLFAPATGIVIDTSGSLNDLHGLTLTDDLNATGADLTYVSHVAYWQGSGVPVSHTFSNAGGLLTFGNFPIVPAGEQIVIEVTVVLDETPANAPGTQFVNTAKWAFGRLIDGVFYQPLPGEWGVTLPMTIAAPDLVVTKTGPATMGSTINLGEWGEFTIDVHNAGSGDAWSATLLDRLPNGATGGMCDLQPEVLSARVTDGVASRPLVAGSDFSLTYAGAPVCELGLTLSEAAGPIRPGEHLLLTYRSKLDADSQNGATLTNIAGATLWFNADSGHAGRSTYTRALTNGTVGIADHEDAHTVAVALSGYLFEKTVVNLTNGQSPAVVAAPGDRLRYTLRLQTTANGLDNFAFYDELDALNAAAAFAPGTLALVGPLPAGAVNNSNPAGGAKGTGLLNVGNLSLPAGSQLLLQFDVVVAATVTDGAIVTNQSQLLVSGAPFTVSDDPGVNGQADPFLVGDEDPTRLTVQLPVPPAPPLKEALQPTATIGERFVYRVTVPGRAATVPLYDVRIQDNLASAASGADLRFVGVTKVAGPGTPVNIGSDISPVIADTVTGIDIPAGGQLVLDVTVELLNTTTNERPLPFSNTASYSYNAVNGDAATGQNGGTSLAAEMRVVEPVVTMEKSVANVTPGKVAADPAAGGDTLEYTLIVTNGGDAIARDVNITDLLPPGVALVDGSATAQINGGSVIILPAPATVAPGTLAWGRASGDDTLDIPVAGLLVLTYRVTVQEITGALLANSSWVDWTSLEAVSPLERTGAGCPNVTLPDDYCAGPAVATSPLVPPVLEFRKSVINETTGQDPGAAASPGDTLRYRLQVRNLGGVPFSNFSLLDEFDRLNDPPLFAPGTLTLVAVPAGSDTTRTEPDGGIWGTGLVDIRNLSIGAAGSANESVFVEFTVRLAPVITNGTVALNQSGLLVDGLEVLRSDETRTLISSAPALRVEKTSQDRTGDPAVLFAGDTLRYILAVRNVGSENAVNVVLRDQLPANTSYVPGSTTLNGAPVADAGSLSPLQGGLPVSTPADPTPGSLPADATESPDHVATVTFDVVVHTDVVDGTILSNQGFANGAGAGGVPLPEKPSDDPATPMPDDPTRDIVGNLPLVYAQKTVQIQVDGDSPGIVDPDDVLRYTITLTNSGSTPATGVVLTDAVPADTTYVADSVVVNGLPAGRPDGGVSPLVAGIAVSSADLTPPLPAAGAGTLSPGGTAVVTFDVRVNPGVAAGTVISNQGSVSLTELPAQPTDADGVPSNGYQPTQVVVGDAQLLAITKEAFVVGGGEALAGGQLEYVVRVSNISTVPALGVVLTDDLGPLGPNPYVSGTATLNGVAAGTGYAAPVLSAAAGDLPAGATLVLRFRATIPAGVPIGTTITNTAEVIWNANQTASARASVDIGGTPGSAILNGSVWHDGDLDGSYDGAERRLEGWSVELYRGSQLLATVTTDAAGAYRLSGLAPNAGTAQPYELRFRAAGAGPGTPSLGYADSPFTDGPQRISDITVASGSNVQGLNLPITPNGTVYNSVLRTPVAGARLAMSNAATGAPLPALCFDDPAQQNQVTARDGFYKFDLNFSDPSCRPGSAYRIEATPPAGGFVAAPSQIIPPNGDPAAPFSVPACPGSADDAVPATAGYCEVTASASAPPPSVAPRTAGTTYHLYLTLSDGFVPGQSQVFNNHIPLDPELAGAVAITKTSSLINVTRGELVPYTITVNNLFGAPLADLGIADRFPAGFKYVEGSARLDGVPREPRISGRELVWDGIALQFNQRRTLQLLLVVGAGVSEGEYVNRALVFNAVTGAGVSGEASATVRVVPDPTFDGTDVIGKVFDDCNLNGYQDEGERGLAGVRVVTARGLIATTDEHGRFHITCATVPDEDRGSNFILKLDDRTLPTGFRLTTENPRVLRATRGKMLRFNFGATLHRVVGIDIADGVFEPESTELRPQWRPTLVRLLEELRKSPAVLRLSYLADVEREGLVRERLAVLKKEVAFLWDRSPGGYRLEIETEVFWRLGGPPEL